MQKRLRAEHRDVHGNADHTGIFQVCKLLNADVKRHHGNAFEAPVAFLQRIQQTRTVGVISRGRADNQRVADVVRLHHGTVILGGANLVTFRTIRRVRKVRKARRIKHVVMGVDLGLLKNCHAFALPATE